MGHPVYFLNNIFKGLPPPPDVKQGGGGGGGGGMEGNSLKNRKDKKGKSSQWETHLFPGKFLLTELRNTYRKLSLPENILGMYWI